MGTRTARLKHDDVNIDSSRVWAETGRILVVKLRHFLLLLAARWSFPRTRIALGCLLYFPGTREVGRASGPAQLSPARFSPPHGCVHVSNPDFWLGFRARLAGPRRQIAGRRLTSYGQQAVGVPGCWVVRGEATRPRSPPQAMVTRAM